MLKIEDIKVCACLGPIKGEEFCPCRMISLGRKTEADYEPTAEEKKALSDALKQFGWTE